MRRNNTHIGIALAALCLPSFLGAEAINYSDGFEGSTLSGFWTETEQFGTISLSADQAKTGTQSLRIASIGGGQREMYLRHDFSGPMKGSASVWFFDSNPGSETLYQHFTLGGWGGIVIGVDDYESVCYKATGATGTNCAYNNYPESGNTTQLRALGWHLFAAEVTANSITLSIDDQVVLQKQGDFSFNFVTLQMTGPGWRPDTVGFWDDFSINAHSANSADVPEPGSMGVAALALACLSVALRSKRR